MIIRDNINSSGMKAKIQPHSLLAGFQIKTEKNNKLQFKENIDFDGKY